MVADVPGVREYTAITGNQESPDRFEPCASYYHIHPVTCLQAANNG